MHSCNGKETTYDLLLVGLLDVRVLFVVRLSLGQVHVQCLPESRSGLGSLIVLPPPQDDRVTHCLESVQSLDVGGFLSILTLLGVEPVLGLGESLEKRRFLGFLDIDGVSVLELSSGVVDVLLESVLSFLVMSARTFLNDQTEPTSVSRTSLSSECILPSFSTKPSTAVLLRPVYWPTT